MWQRQERAGTLPKDWDNDGNHFLCSQAILLILELAGVVWKSSSNLLAPVGICLWEPHPLCTSFGPQSLLDNNPSHQRRQPLLPDPTAIPEASSTHSVLQQQLCACDKRVHTVHVGDSLPQEGAYLHVRGSRWTLGSMAGRSALLIPWDIYRKPLLWCWEMERIYQTWKQTQRIRHGEETEECILMERTRQNLRKWTKWNRDNQFPWLQSEK